MGFTPESAAIAGAIGGRRKRNNPQTSRANGKAHVSRRTLGEAILGHRLTPTGYLALKRACDKLGQNFWPDLTRIQDWRVPAGTLLPPDTSEYRHALKMLRIEFNWQLRRLKP